MSTTGKLVLGTVQFGVQYGINSAGRPDEQMVKAILEEAQALGINTLDTSSGYGEAEEILGRTISKGHPFKIVSKYPKGNVPVKEMFLSSLDRLKVNSLFGYLLHHFEVYRDNPDVWREFMALKEDGKVQRIGFSLYMPDELEILLKNNVDFNLLQIPRNIFDRKFDPYLRELKDRGVEIHVRSTFLQGLFFKDRQTLPDKLKPLKKYLEELDNISKETGMSIAELALNFNYQNENIAGVLIGVDNVDQLKTNVGSLSDQSVNIDISVKEKELLNPVNWN